jgi:hypothetical protein
MKEILIGRNPVFEALRARRRQGFRLLVAEGAQEKSLSNVFPVCVSIAWMLITRV